MDFVLGIVGILIGLLVPVVGWWISQRNAYVFSWRKIVSAVKQMYEALRARDIEPDVVLAFAKGGLIVADLLNVHFGERPHICVISTRRVTTGNERKVVCDATYAHLELLAGKKVLLVDDVVQSGSTLRAVVQLLVEQYGAAIADITVAVLAMPKGAVLYRPDIHVFEYEETDKRAVLPWGELTMD